MVRGCNGTLEGRSILRILFTAAAAAALAAAPVAAAPVEDSGVRRINLKVTNELCRALTPDGASAVNPNPSDLNDGNLDDIEIEALNDGCDLRAIATDRFGRRVPGVTLYLVRAAAGSSNYESFGRPRTTNRRGVATWGFSLGAETDFIYRVRIRSREVQSNPINVELCTGLDTVELFPNQADAGRGCP